MLITNTFRPSRSLVFAALAIVPLINGCSPSETAEPTAGIAAASNAFQHFPPQAEGDRLAVDDTRLFNAEAPIPPQCYTRTEQTHNPCYVCHQAYPRDADAPYRMNKLDDGALQGNYLFSDIGARNHWQNLFVDRTAYVAAIDDATIDAYVAQDNYSPLAGHLRNSGWQGYTPDLDNFQQAGAAFDDNGFARDGSGWVAFNYKPFPSTFWPTNGSTGDVAIRLPAAFRHWQGHADNAIYALNLALVELTIKDLDWIDVAPLDEARYQLDIDGDQQLRNGTTRLLRRSHFVGDASHQQVLPQQYPEGTELLHSVRYLGVAGDGDIFLPPRMKELRYMQKFKTMTDADLDNRYRRERKEKLEQTLPYFLRHGERGMENNMGWLMTGFIEDARGQLRPQSHEETFACMGCHAAIGSTIDQTFAFGRKITGRAGWGYIDLKGMADAPTVSHPEPEILAYLKRVGGGDEFRQNDEMLARWFDADGRVREDAVRAADVYTLITPSRARAHAE